MFDLGFVEMLVVGIIALLVLGPERLPVAVRTVGLTIGRIKRGFADVQAQVEREIGADEIRQQLHNERILKDLEKPEPAAADDPPKRPVSNVRRNAPPSESSEAPVEPPRAEAGDATETPELLAKPGPAANTTEAESVVNESLNRPHER